MKYLITISLIALCSSCTTAMKPGNQSQGRLENVDTKNYTLNTKQSAFVGEQIIERKSYQAVVKSDSFQTLNSFSLQGGFGGTGINLTSVTGDTFTIAGQNEKGNPVVRIPGSIFMFGINNRGEWDKSVMSNSFWTSPIGSGEQYSMYPTNTKFKKVESKTPLSEAGYVNHEIIFTGIGANGISLMYREYTFKDMARSDFKQSLVYPINTQKIRFRNYQIDLISISPSEITYTVTSD